MMKNIRNSNNFTRGYKVSSKAYLTVPSNLNEVIIGTMLGDGSVNKTGINHNSRLSFKQSIKNRIYIDHLYSLLQEYCGARPLLQSYLDKRANKVYRSIGFQTLRLPCFNIYNELFYKFDGKRYIKKVPLDLNKLLTPKALAYWIMDDGYKLNEGLCLSTESFSMEEHQLIINVLQDKFYLDCSIHGSISRNRNKLEVYIKSSSRNDLRSLVINHLLPHFYYKLDL